MTLRLLRFTGAVFFIVLAVGALYWFSLDQVTFTINGHSYEVRLRGKTVADAVDAADVLVESADQIEPSLNTPLSDGLIIQIKKAEQVAVEADGQILRIYTHSSDPLIILSEANIQIGHQDEVLADGISLSQRPFSQRPPRVIRVIRAVSVTIQEHETAFNITTTAETVGGALNHADLFLYVADKVNPSLDTPLVEGMTIEIIRSRPVTIFMDGRSMVTRTTAATVQAALAELGIVLSGLDYVIPHETAAFDSTIRIVRVTETFEIVEESLPYRTLVRPDENLPLDTRQSLQAGENGLLKKRFRLRLEDGQVVSRILLDSWVENKPVDEVVAYGTQIQIRTLSTEQGDIEYWRVLTLNVTATSGLLQPGEAAVDPEVIPLGSPLYIEGYGMAVAAAELPEGGFLIALGYGNIQHGTVEVYLLTPPPDEFPYLLQESP